MSFVLILPLNLVHTKFILGFLFYQKAVLRNLPICNDTFFICIATRLKFLTLIKLISKLMKGTFPAFKNAIPQNFLFNLTLASQHQLCAILHFLFTSFLPHKA